MKTPFLLLLSLFACFSLSAQIWPLAPNDRIGNYRHSAESLISNHIWVESVGILPEGDSVFYLNRIARLFFDVEPPDDVVDFGLTNQQQFLQRQVRKGADGGYRFEGDSATFVLFGGLMPGSEWLFDTVQQITAIVLDQGEQTTFGVADSVQSVLLSTQDTILLSKNFGILRFPDFDQPGQFFELVGLDGTPYGEQVPKGPDFFQIEPGDVLFYEGGDYFGPDIGDGPRYRGKFELEEKYMNGDTLVLRFLRTLRSEFYAWQLSDWLYLATHTDIYFVRIPPDHFSHFYKGQVAPVPANTQEFTFECIHYPLDSILYGVINYFPAEDSTLMKGIGYDPFDWVNLPLLALSKNGDSLLRVESYYGYDWDYHIYYQQGPGLRKWGGWCHEISGNKELTGSIISGDTLGQVYNEEFLFHTGVEDLLNESSFRLFPNPATDEVYLKAPEDFRFREVRVVSVVGKMIRRISFEPTDQTTLNLEGIPNGLYFLLLSDETGRQAVVSVLKE